MPNEALRGALREDLNDIRGIAVKIQPVAILACSRLFAICNTIEKHVEAALASPAPASTEATCGCLPDWLAQGIHQHGCPKASVQASEDVRKLADEIVGAWLSTTGSGEKYIQLLSSALQAERRKALEEFYHTMTKCCRERGAEKVYNFMLEYCGALAARGGAKP